MAENQVTTPDVVWFQNPNGGDPISVPAADAQQAAQSGYKPADPATVQAYIEGKQQADQFGTPGQAALTALEHAGSALTLGGSTWAERMMGVPAENIAARSKQNPVAGALGTGLGVIGPAIATGGGSAAAQGAEGAAEGGSLLARAAQFTAPAVISRVGRAAEGLIPEAAEGAGLAERALTAAGQQAIGGAVEGAFYGTGDVVDESALGDPNLTAQSALAHIGLSAALGGGMGAAMGGGLESAGDVIGKAKNALESAGNRTRQALEDLATARGAAETGLAPEEVRSLLKEGPSLQSPEAMQRTVQDTTKELQKAYDAVQDVSSFVRKNTEAEMHQATRAVPAERAQKAADEVLTDILKTQQQIAAHPATLKQGAADTLEKLVEEYRGKVDEESTAGHVMVALNELKQDMRKQLSIFSKDPSVEAQATNDLMKSLQGRLKDALENESVWGEAGARQAARNESWAALLQAQGAETGKTTADTFRKQFMTKTVDGWKVSEDRVARWLKNPNNEKGLLANDVQGRYLDAASGFVRQAEDVARTANVPFESAPVHDMLSKAVENVGGGLDFAQQVKKLNGLTGENIKEGLGGRLSGGRGGLGKIVEGVALSNLASAHPAVALAYSALKGWKQAGDVPRMVAVLSNLERAQKKVLAAIDTGASVLVRGSQKAAYIGRGEVAAGLARHFGGNQKSSERMYSKRTDELNHLAGSAEALQDRLVQQSDGWDQHAPQTAQAAQAATVRAVQFLQSKIPQHPPRGPLDAKWIPNKSEMSKFNRYYDAVHRPTSILKQAAAGTLTPEAVEAVKTVYPELFGRMQQAVLGKIADSNGHVPYQNRAMLSLLLGQPMDSTTQPGSLKMAQMTYANAAGRGQQHQQQGQVRPTAGGLGKMHAADRMLLPSQKLAQK